MARNAGPDFDEELVRPNIPGLPHGSVFSVDVPGKVGRQITTRVHRQRALTDMKVFGTGAGPREQLIGEGKRYGSQAGGRVIGRDVVGLGSSLDGDVGPTPRVEPVVADGNGVLDRR